MNKLKLFFEYLAWVFITVVLLAIIVLTAQELFGFY